MHLEFAPQEVVFVGCGLIVGMMNSHYLPYNIVVVLHGDVVARGVLHRLAVASFLVGIALGMPAQRIGHPRFEHRLAVVGDDAVGRGGHSPIGQRNLRRAVVGVVFGGCLYNCLLSLNFFNLLLFLSEQSQQLDSLKTQEYLAQLPLALLTFPC